MTTGSVPMIMVGSGTARALDGGRQEEVVDDIADQRELDGLQPVGARELAQGRGRSNQARGRAIRPKAR